MDQTAFVQELATLTALPPEQVNQAIAIAQSLNETQRQELFEKLRQIDKELSEAIGNQQQALSGFGVVLQDARTRMKKLDRTSAESQAQAGTVEGVAERISQL